MASEHKDHANVKIHPPVLLVIHIFVAWLLGRFVVLPIVISPLFKNIGLALAGIGFLFGLLSLYAFTKARTTVNPHGSVRAIVSTGIYRFTRNPIYLGMVMMLIGFPLAFGNVWGFPLTPVFIFLMNVKVEASSNTKRHTWRKNLGRGTQATSKGRRLDQRQDR
ncbi:MAG: methyltransferase [Anaerolineales bacterium]